MEGGVGREGRRRREGGRSMEGGREEHGGREGWREGGRHREEEEGERREGGRSREGGREEHGGREGGREGGVCCVSMFVSLCVCMCGRVKFPPFSPAHQQVPATCEWPSPRLPLVHAA